MFCKDTINTRSLCRR